MSNINTEIIQALALGQSIDKIICSELQNAINHLLKTELTTFLDYEPYDPIGYNSGNSRNGSYKRKIETKYGEIEVDIPRDRCGEFNQETIPPYKRRTDDLETTILQLYSKGVTTSEIADLIEKMYGHAYSPQTISNITKAVQENADLYRTVYPLNKSNMIANSPTFYSSLIVSDYSKMYSLIGIEQNTSATRRMSYFQFSDIFSRKYYSAKYRLVEKTFSSYDYVNKVYINGVEEKYVVNDKYLKEKDLDTYPSLLSNVFIENNSINNNIHTIKHKNIKKEFPENLNLKKELSRE